MSSDKVQERQDGETRKKGCGCVLPLALTAFLLVALPVVFYLIFTTRAARLVEAELAKIRAAGEPATAEELDDYYEYPHIDEDATQLWLAAIRPLDGEEYDNSCGELPIVGYSEEEKTIPPPGQRWEDQEAVEEFLAKYADSLDLMHQAAEKGGAARYQLEFSEGWGMLLPHVTSYRAAAHILSLQAHVRAHRGDVGGAAESIRTIFSLGESVKEEPVLVSQLVRIAVDNMACDLLCDLLPHSEFSDEELAAFRADIQAIDNDAALQRAMVGERALTTNMFLNPASLDDFDMSVVSHLGPRNDDLVLYLQFMNDYLAASRKPWPRRLDDTEAVEEHIQTSQAAGINRFRYILTFLTTPAIGATVGAFATNEATIRATDAALAVEQFSRKNGSLPETLDELVPEFLDEVPLDPFDGKPLRYSRRDNACIIHSIGKDRVDDGGQIIEENNEFGDYVDNPDIIFSVEGVKK